MSYDALERGLRQTVIGKTIDIHQVTAYLTKIHVYAFGEKTPHFDVGCCVMNMQFNGAPAESTSVDRSHIISTLFSIATLVLTYPENYFAVFPIISEVKLLLMDTAQVYLLLRHKELYDPYIEFVTTFATKLSAPSKSLQDAILESDLFDVFLLLSGYTMVTPLGLFHVPLLLRPPGMRSFFLPFADGYKAGAGNTNPHQRAYSRFMQQCEHACENVDHFVNLGMAIIESPAVTATTAAFFIKMLPRLERSAAFLGAAIGFLTCLFNNSFVDLLYNTALYEDVPLSVTPVLETSLPPEECGTVALGTYLHRLCAGEPNLRSSYETLRENVYADIGHRILSLAIQMAPTSARLLAHVVVFFFTAGPLSADAMAFLLRGNMSSVRVPTHIALATTKVAEKTPFFLRGHLCRKLSHYANALSAMCGTPFRAYSAALAFEFQESDKTLGFLEMFRIDINSIVLGETAEDLCQFNIDLRGYDETESFYTQLKQATTNPDRYDYAPMLFAPDSYDLYVLSCTLYHVLQEEMAQSYGLGSVGGLAKRDMALVIAGTEVRADNYADTLLQSTGACAGPGAGPGAGTGAGAAPTLVRCNSPISPLPVPVTLSILRLVDSFLRCSTLEAPELALVDVLFNELFSTPLYYHDVFREPQSASVGHRHGHPDSAQSNSNARNAYPLVQGLVGLIFSCFCYFNGERCPIFGDTWGSQVYNKSIQHSCAAEVCKRLGILSPKGLLDQEPDTLDCVPIRHVRRSGGHGRGRSRSRSCSIGSSSSHEVHYMRVHGAGPAVRAAGAAHAAHAADEAAGASANANANTNADADADADAGTNAETAGAFVRSVKRQCMALFVELLNADVGARHSRLLPQQLVSEVAFATVHNMLDCCRSRPAFLISVMQMVAAKIFRLEAITREYIHSHLAFYQKAVLLMVHPVRMPFPSVEAHTEHYRFVRLLKQLTCDLCYYLMFQVFVLTAREFQYLDLGSSSFLDMLSYFYSPETLQRPVNRDNGVQLLTLLMQLSSFLSASTGGARAGGAGGAGSVGSIDSASDSVLATLAQTFAVIRSVTGKMPVDCRNQLILQAVTRTLDNSPAGIILYHSEKRLFCQFMATQLDGLSGCGFALMHAIGRFAQIEDKSVLRARLTIPELLDMLCTVILSSRTIASITALGAASGLVLAQPAVFEVLLEQALDDELTPFNRSLILDILALVAGNTLNYPLLSRCSFLAPLSRFMGESSLFGMAGCLVNGEVPFLSSSVLGSLLESPFLGGSVLSDILPLASAHLTSNSPIVSQALYQITYDHFSKLSHRRAKDGGDSTIAMFDEAGTTPQQGAISVSSSGQALRTLDSLSEVLVGTKYIEPSPEHTDEQRSTPARTQDDRTQLSLNVVEDFSMEILKLGNNICESAVPTIQALLSAPALINKLLSLICQPTLLHTNNIRQVYTICSPPRILPLFMRYVKVVLKYLSKFDIFRFNIALTGVHSGVMLCSAADGLRKDTLRSSFQHNLGVSDVILVKREFMVAPPNQMLSLPRGFTFLVTMYLTGATSNQGAVLFHVPFDFGYGQCFVIVRIVDAFSLAVEYLYKKTEYFKTVVKASQSFFRRPATFGLIFEAPVACEARISCRISIVIDSEIFAIDVTLYTFQTDKPPALSKQSAAQPSRNTNRATSVELRQTLSVLTVHNIFTGGFCTKVSESAISFTKSASFLLKRMSLLAMPILSRNTLRMLAATSTMVLLWRRERSLSVVHSIQTRYPGVNLSDPSSMFYADPLNKFVGLWARNMSCEQFSRSLVPYTHGTTHSICFAGQHIGVFSSLNDLVNALHGDLMMSSEIFRRPSPRGIAAYVDDFLTTIRNVLSSNNFYAWDHYCIDPFLRLILFIAPSDLTKAGYETIMSLVSVLFAKNHSFSEVLMSHLMAFFAPKLFLNEGLQALNQRMFRHALSPDTFHISRETTLQLVLGSRMSFRLPFLHMYQIMWTSSGDSLDSTTKQCSTRQSFLPPYTNRGICSRIPLEDTTCMGYFSLIMDICIDLYSHTNLFSFQRLMVDTNEFAPEIFYTVLNFAMTCPCIPQKLAILSTLYKMMLVNNCEIDRMYDPSVVIDLARSIYTTRFFSDVHTLSHSDKDTARKHESVGRITSLNTLYLFLLFGTASPYMESSFWSRLSNSTGSHTSTKSSTGTSGSHMGLFSGHAEQEETPRDPDALTSNACFFPFDESCSLTDHPGSIAYIETVSVDHTPDGTTRTSNLSKQGRESRESSFGGSIVELGKSVGQKQTRRTIRQYDVGLASFSLLPKELYTSGLGAVMLPFLLIIYDARIDSHYSPRLASLSCRRAFDVITQYYLTTLRSITHQLNVSFRSKSPPRTDQLSDPTDASQPSQGHAELITLFSEHVATIVRSLAEDFSFLLLDQLGAIISQSVNASFAEHSANDASLQKSKEKSPQPDINLQVALLDKSLYLVCVSLGPRFSVVPYTESPPSQPDHTEIVLANPLNILLLVFTTVSTLRIFSETRELRILYRFKLFLLRVVDLLLAVYDSSTAEFKYNIIQLPLLDSLLMFLCVHAVSWRVTSTGFVSSVFGKATEQLAEFFKPITFSKGVDSGQTPAICPHTILDYQIVLGLTKLLSYSFLAQNCKGTYIHSALSSNLFINLNRRLILDPLQALTPSAEQDTVGASRVSAILTGIYHYLKIHQIDIDINKVTFLTHNVALYAPLTPVTLSILVSYRSGKVKPGLAARDIFNTYYDYLRLVIMDLNGFAMSFGEFLTASGDESAASMSSPLTQDERTLISDGSIGVSQAAGTFDSTYIQRNEVFIAISYFTRLHPVLSKTAILHKMVLAHACQNLLSDITPMSRHSHRITRFGYSPKVHDIILMFRLILLAEQTCWMHSLFNNHFLLSRSEVKGFELTIDIIKYICKLIPLSGVDENISAYLDDSSLSLAIMTSFPVRSLLCLFPQKGKRLPARAPIPDIESIDGLRHTTEMSSESTERESLMVSLLRQDCIIAGVYIRYHFYLCFFELDAPTFLPTILGYLKTLCPNNLTEKEAFKIVQTSQGVASAITEDLGYLQKVYCQETLHGDILFHGADSASSGQAPHTSHKLDSRKAEQILAQKPVHLPLSIMPTKRLRGDLPAEATRALEEKVPLLRERVAILFVACTMALSYKLGFLKIQEKNIANRYRVYDQKITGASLVRRPGSSAPPMMGSTEAGADSLSTRRSLQRGIDLLKLSLRKIKLQALALVLNRLCSSHNTTIASYFRAYHINVEPIIELFADPTILFERLCDELTERTTNGSIVLEHFVVAMTKQIRSISTTIVWTHLDYETVSDLYQTYLNSFGAAYVAIPDEFELRETIVSRLLKLSTLEQSILSHPEYTRYLEQSRDPLARPARHPDAHVQMQTLPGSDKTIYELLSIATVTASSLDVCVQNRLNTVYTAEAIGGRASHSVANAVNFSDGSRAVSFTVLAHEYFTALFKFTYAIGAYIRSSFFFGIDVLPKSKSHRRLLRARNALNLGDVSYVRYDTASSSSSIFMHCGISLQSKSSSSRSIDLRANIRASVFRDDAHSAEARTLFSHHSGIDVGHQRSANSSPQHAKASGSKTSSSQPGAGTQAHPRSDQPQGRSSNGSGSEACQTTLMDLISPKYISWYRSEPYHAIQIVEYCAMDVLAAHYELWREFIMIRALSNQLKAVQARVAQTVLSTSKYSQRSLAESFCVVSNLAKGAAEIDVFRAWLQLFDLSSKRASIDDQVRLSQRFLLRELGGPALTPSMMSFGGAKRYIGPFTETGAEPRDKEPWMQLDPLVEPVVHIHHTLFIQVEARMHVGSIHISGTLVINPFTGLLTFVLSFAERTDYLRPLLADLQRNSTFDYDGTSISLKTCAIILYGMHPCIHASSIVELRAGRFNNMHRTVMHLASNEVYVFEFTSNVGMQRLLKPLSLLMELSVCSLSSVYSHLVQLRTQTIAVPTKSLGTILYGLMFQKYMAITLRYPHIFLNLFSYTLVNTNKGQGDFDLRSLIPRNYIDKMVLTLATYPHSIHLSHLCTFPQIFISRPQQPSSGDTELIRSLESLIICNSRIFLASISAMWSRGLLNNYAYIFALNTFARRSLSDKHLSPIYPLLVTNILDAETIDWAFFNTCGDIGEPSAVMPLDYLTSAGVDDASVSWEDILAALDWNDPRMATSSNICEILCMPLVRDLRYPVHACNLFLYARKLLEYHSALMSLKRTHDSSTNQYPADSSLQREHPSVSFRGASDSVRTSCLAIANDATAYSTKLQLKNMLSSVLGPQFLSGDHLVYLTKSFLPNCFAMFTHALRDKRTKGRNVLPSRPQFLKHAPLASINLPCLRQQRGILLPTEHKGIVSGNALRDLFRICSGVSARLTELSSLYYTTPQAFLEAEEAEMLPLWAPTAQLFVDTNRRILESRYVTENLHYWVDLVFGVNQRSIRRLNYISKSCHVDQVFFKPSKRKSAPILYSDVKFVRLLVPQSRSCVPQPSDVSFSTTNTGTSPISGLHNLPDPQGSLSAASFRSTTGTLGMHSADTKALSLSEDVSAVEVVYNTNASPLSARINPTPRRTIIKEAQTSGAQIGADFAESIAFPPQKHSLSISADATMRLTSHSPLSPLAEQPERRLCSTIVSSPDSSTSLIYRSISSAQWPLKTAMTPFIRHVFHEPITKAFFYPSNNGNLLVTDQVCILLDVTFIPNSSEQNSTVAQFIQSFFDGSQTYGLSRVDTVRSRVYFVSNYEPYNGQYHALSPFTFQRPAISPSLLLHCYIDKNCAQRQFVTDLIAAVQNRLHKTRDIIHHHTPQHERLLPAACSPEPSSDTSRVDYFPELTQQASLRFSRELNAHVESDRAWKSVSNPVTLYPTPSDASLSVVEFSLATPPDILLRTGSILILKSRKYGCISLQRFFLNKSSDSLCDVKIFNQDILGANISSGTITFWSRDFVSVWFLYNSNRDIERLVRKKGSKIPMQKLHDDSDIMAAQSLHKSKSPVYRVDSTTYPSTCNNSAEVSSRDTAPTREHCVSDDQHESAQDSTLKFDSLFEEDAAPYIMYEDGVLMHDYALVRFCEIESGVYSVSEIFNPFQLHFLSTDVLFAATHLPTRRVGYVTNNFCLYVSNIDSHNTILTISLSHYILAQYVKLVDECTSGLAPKANFLRSISSAFVANFSLRGFFFLSSGDIALVVLNYQLAKVFFYVIFVSLRIITFQAVTTLDSVERNFGVQAAGDVLYLINGCSISSWTYTNCALAPTDNYVTAAPIVRIGFLNANQLLAACTINSVDVFNIRMAIE